MHSNLARRAVTVGALLVTSTLGMGMVAGAASADVVSDVLDAAEAVDGGIAGGCTVTYAAREYNNVRANGPTVTPGIPAGGYDIGDPVALATGVEGGTRSWVWCFA